jgi:very-short-patch-repair endonuclease/RecA/RadA recombinase
MLDRSDDDRLLKIYEQLRAKLLDLTKRNRMLSYPMGAKARRQVQIVGADVQAAYDAMVAEARIVVAPLAEPESTPADEKTDEFADALHHDRVSDLEYLVALEGLAATANDGDRALERIERSLRDRTRARLGLPPRTSKTEISRVEHARSLGIDPSQEAKASVAPRRQGEPLQTLRFPDEHEATMEKLVDEARLAEQESGLSTLFLAFGFVEWYDSETSDKAYYAPLLLLPVRIEKRRLRGRPVYDLVASEPTADQNVSLRKFLETEHGRELPAFVEGESERPASIEAYFKAVQSSIEGLHRWSVRRFVVLGHFAFSRIAIYEDVAPERWLSHPLDNPLIRSLLAGYEAGGGSGSDFHGAEDYRIDDPEVEKIAPILVHDADASQHSALVDVMKGKNLVIQGPPGTGKSQTITNIVANALSAGQTVLFVSEKQAALEVVKRRLDAAKLGDFCLELHSEKSSAKAVIGALYDRHQRSVGKQEPIPPRADAAWSAARTQIADYLDALHAPEVDGKTPFDLIWDSIRSGAAHADTLAELGKVDLPAYLFGDIVELTGARDRLELYASEAQRFAETFGHPSQSPWASAPPNNLAHHQRAPLLSALAEAQNAARALSALFTAFAEEGIAERADAEAILTADASLAEAPPAELLIAILQADATVLEAALRLKASALKAKDALREFPVIDDAITQALPIASSLAAAAKAAGYGDDVTPAGIRARAQSEDRRRRSFVDAVERLRPAATLLGIEFGARVEVLESVAAAAELVDGIDPSSSEWIGAQGIDEERFGLIKETWQACRDEALFLRKDIPGRLPLPAASELEDAANVLGRGGLGGAIARLKGEVKNARAVAYRVGLDDDVETTTKLTRLARHIRAVDAFEAEVSGPVILGTAWKGMATPFEDIEGGLLWSRYIESDIGQRRDGAAIAARIVRLSPADRNNLAGYAQAAAAYRTAVGENSDVSRDRTIAESVRYCERQAEAATRLLALDSGGALSTSALTLQSLAAIAAARMRLEVAAAAVQESGCAPVLRFVQDAGDLEKFRKAQSWLQSASRLSVPAQSFQGFTKDPSAWRTRLRHMAQSFAGPIAAFDDGVRSLATFGLDSIGALSLSAFGDQIETLLQHRDQLGDFASLYRSRSGLEATGLRDFLARADAALLPASQLPQVFDAALSQRRADAALRASQPLAHGSGGDLEAKRRFFAQRDKDRVIADRQRVRRQLLEREPPFGERPGAVKTWTEMCLLNNEFPKQKAFTPVRGLLKRAGGAVRALKPCFMMSPLSLAKFLSADSKPFDLLVIDEASQMRPEDALGAMLRAKQIVIVGDAKQLPPTSFFARAADEPDDGEEDEVDDESILERCQKAFRQIRRLKWHYRSRCESLIRFSNENFYDNGLVTFPAAAPGSFSIDLIRVAGIYQGRRNVAEAERIAEEAVGLMRHFCDSPEGSVPTLGIVAVNVEQRELIQETLRLISVNDEKVAEYLEKVERQGEPVFVKNLENVQGDERDFVFISLTYGRAPGASVVIQRFGPINSKQGHRRLNVLFSRARRRVALFTSLTSGDVVPSTTSQEGVHILKRYLEYAEGAGRATVKRIGGVADSAFELEVAERLARRGYAVDLQIGVSGFRIDLGVRHPDHPEMFLAGVECDGASYHSSKSARDRDRLREEVLRGLGWDLVRVWSTDWFSDPDLQTEKLVRRLEELRVKPTRADKAYVVGHLYAGGEPPEIILTADAGCAGESQGQHIEVPSHSGNQEPAVGGDGSGPLNEAEAADALVAYRENVIRPAAADWEPHRSILRDGLIETFIKQRLSDPEDWYVRVPMFQRAGTNPVERRDHLEAICAIVARIIGNASEVTKHPRLGAELASTGAAKETPAAAFPAAPPSGANPGTYLRAELDVDPSLGRDGFYEPSYLQRLKSLVADVIELEAPIYGDVLAIRVARAHGFGRTGATIRQMVSDAAAGRFPVTQEEGREVFWKPNGPSGRIVPFRPSDEQVRSHGDVPIGELASLALSFLGRALSDEQILRAMAERLRLGRVAAPARRRFESALALAKVERATSGP